jgi:putative peptidoglycan lipid II flippase
LGSAGRVAGWTFAAAVLAQLGLLVTTNVANQAAAANEGTAAELATAGPAAYTLALLLFMLPHSLVAVSLVTALFTRMSAAAGDDDWLAVRDDLSLGLRTVGVFSVLATAGLVALAEPVAVAMTGNLDSGRALGRVITAMALGLTGFSATYLLQRVYYAYEDARTPFLVTIPQVAVIVVVDLLSVLLLPPEWVVVGVGAGMSLASTVSAVLSAVLLRRRHGSIDGHRVLRTHVRLLIIGTASATLGVLSASWLGWQQGGRLPALASCLVVGMLVTLGYLAGLRLLRVRELGRFVGRGLLGKLLIDDQSVTLPRPAHGRTRAP